MIDPGMPIGPLDAAGYRPRTERTPHSGAHGAEFSVALSRELEGPPAEVRAQVETAARRWQELRAVNRELHFAQSADGERIVVEVRDLQGNLLDTIPPSRALEIAAGGPLP